MLKWEKTVRGNYISSLEYQNTKYRLQVFTNGVYKVVEIAYRINIVGRTEPYNKVILEGFCSDVFNSMTLAEKSLKKFLHIKEEITPQISTTVETEKVITKEEEKKLEASNPEIYEKVKEEIKEQQKPICTTPTIGLVTTEIGTYVTLSGDSDDEIRFTLNNKSVSSSSKLYRKPFLLKADMIIKAKAFNENKRCSKQVRYSEPKEK